MDKVYSGEANKIVALAKESGVGRSTIQRIVDPATYAPVGPSIDVVGEIAGALGCEPYELLVPEGD
jgi:hypothetical protein